MARFSRLVKPAVQDALHLKVLRTERLSPHWARITLGEGISPISSRSDTTSGSGCFFRSAAKQDWSACRQKPGASSAT